MADEEDNMERRPEDEYPTAQDAGIRPPGIEGPVPGADGEILVASDAGPEEDEGPPTEGLTVAEPYVPEEPEQSDEDGEAEEEPEEVNRPRTPRIGEVALVSTVPKRDIRDFTAALGNTVRAYRQRKTRKTKKSGRPKLLDGVAGLYIRTETDKDHIHQYIKERVLDLVDRMGGPENLLPEQDMMIGFMGACLEAALLMQKRIFDDPDNADNDELVSKLTGLNSSFHKGLRLLGLHKPPKEAPTDPKKDARTLLQEVHRRQRGRKV